MPATSQEPSGSFASRSEFQTGGSGRRKRVSARHQVKRSGLVFDRVRSGEIRFGGRRKFSSSVRIQRSAVSPALVAGWDLVLTCSPTPSFHAGALSPGVLIPRILNRSYQAAALPAWQRITQRRAARCAAKSGVVTNSASLAVPALRSSEERCTVSGTRTVAMVIALPNGRVNRIPRAAR